MMTYGPWTDPRSGVNPPSRTLAAAAIVVLAAGHSNWKRLQAGASSKLTCMWHSCRARFPGPKGLLGRSSLLTGAQGLQMYERGTRLHSIATDA